MYPVTQSGFEEPTQPNVPVLGCRHRPVLTAAGASRIVEIGALRGETTELMLERLGPEAELHVIDPVPDFDPAEHEQRFAGPYVFHRDLSLDVLPSSRRWTPPSSTATTTGTRCTTSSQLLADVARDAGAPLPVMILHDVRWPYGRRDLYYDPERIPEEFRQPYGHGRHAPGPQAAAPAGAG